MELREARADYWVEAEQRVPKGYKQTEVGVIPEDWDIVLMGSLGTFSKGQGIRKDEATSGDIPCIRYGEIYTCHNDIIRAFNSKISADVARTSKRLKKGDLLFAGSGETKEEIGKCVAFVGDDEAYAGGDIVILSPNKGESTFFGYLFNSPVIVLQKASKGQGDAVVHISASALSSVKLPLPPTKAEQQAIAEALSDADALIESLEQLIVKKRHLKQGTMQELLTGKKRLPGFSEEWDVKRIGEFTDCTSGGTPSTLMPQYWNGAIRWMSSGELNLKNVCEVEGRITEEGLRNSSTKMIPSNCVLVGLAGQGKTRGTVAMNRIELCTNQSIAAILPNAAFDAEYLYYNLDARYRELRELSTGDGGRGGLNLTIIRSLAVSFPKISEQTAIAAILSDMDAEIAALETKLTKTRSIKQGMMYNLLTGKIRLIDPAIVKVEQHALVGVESIPAVPKSDKSHNWAFNEAVVIAMLADLFVGKSEFPLGRKRYTKLSYLMHRKAEQEVQGYLKKAAGPYNPKTKYAGPEKIAQENGYIRWHEYGNYRGFIADEKIEQAKAYFIKWYGSEIIAWLEQFRYRLNDDLERLATVDMAMQELLKQGKAADVDSVRALIASEPEWLPKLERSTFSDSGIAAAIAECHTFFTR